MNVVKQILKCFIKQKKNKCKKCLSNEYKNRKDKRDYINKQSEWTDKNLIKFRVLSVKHRAKRSNVEFELTTGIIYKKLKEQNYKCFISNVPLSFHIKKPYSLSIDRVNSSKGYIIGNIILATKFINISKNDLSLDNFLGLLKESTRNI